MIGRSVRRNSPPPIQVLVSAETNILDNPEVEDDERRLDAISTYNYLAAFQQARAKRYQETGGWIFQTAEFEQWQQLKHCSVVWLSGKSESEEANFRSLLNITTDLSAVGSGKTILR